MTHYTCSGECKGVSDVSGTCQSDSCKMNGQSLAECSCDDSSHANASENSQN